MIYSYAVYFVYMQIIYINSKIGMLFIAIYGTQTMNIYTPTILQLYRYSIGLFCW